MSSSRTGNDASPSSAATTKTPTSEKLKGFAAGTASGLTKLTIGQPFDMIKTRMQCSPPGTFTGPLDCLKSVIGREGLRALYKGASPPAVGWAITDSILLGSLHNYRLLLAKHTSLVRPPDPNDSSGGPRRLAVSGHALAGVFAGFTVALAATPIELLKVQLQMQLHPASPLLARHLSPASADLLVTKNASAAVTTATATATTTAAKPPVYHSPIGFAKQIYAHNGVLGFWHGVGATMLQRMWFGAMFGSYDIMMRYWRQPVLKKDGSMGPRLNEATANFVSGGMGSNLFWIFAYPFDIVKNRLMSDSITNPKYPTWRSAATAIWREGGIRAVYRGFVPCILRAFPTNGGALFVWEGVMRFLEAEKVR